MKKLYHFPTDCDIVFVTSVLSKTFGGRTRSLLKRARLLTEGTNNTITILATNYNFDFNEVERDYRSTGKINDNIKIGNLYLELMGSSKPKKAKVDTLKDRVQEKGYIEVKDDTKNNIFHYYKDGHEVFYKNYDVKTKKLHHKDIFTEGSKTPIKRQYYSNSGHLHMEKLFKLNTRTPYQVTYLDHASNPYLIKVMQDKDTVEKVIYLRHEGGKGIAFPNEKELFKYWFENRVKRKTVFINDARLLDRPLISIEDEKVRSIHQVHNNHHTIPDDLSSPVKGSFKFILNNLNKVSALVSLTNDQAESMLADSPLDDTNNLRIIPHSIEPIEQAHEREKNKINILARLDDQKRLEHAIKAFAIFSKSNPQYTMDIYGEGSLKDFLQGIIDEEGINDRCVLKGFTTAINEKFQTATFTVMSSNFEGFPLAILECLSNGCPIVSYDLNFGPRDMIVEGVNGYLAEFGNIEDLADKMTQMAQTQFDENAVRNTIAPFSDEAFKARWYDVIENAYNEMK